MNSHRARLAGLLLLLAVPGARAAPEVHEARRHHRFADAVIALGRQVPAEPADPEALRPLLLEWAEILDVSGDSAGAIEVLTVVLRSAEEDGRDRDRGAVRTLAALTRAWRGNSPQSRRRTVEYDARARGLLASMPTEHLLWGDVLGAWANQVRYTQGAEAAIPVYREAVRRLRRGTDPVRLAEALTWLAYLQHRPGSAEVDRLAREAIELLDGAGCADHPLKTVALDLLVSSAITRGELAPARPLSDEALRIGVLARASQLPDLRHWGSTSSALRVELELAAGDGVAAWSRFVEGSGLRTRDALLSARLSEESGAARSRRLDLAERRREFGPRYRAWREGENDAPSTREMLVELSGLLAAHGAHLEQWQRTVGAARPYGGPDGAALAEDEAYVSWVASGGSLIVAPTVRSIHAVVQRGGGPPRWIRLASFDEPAEFEAWRAPFVRRMKRAVAAARWADQLGADAGLDSLSRAVYERVFAPLEPALRGVERLIVLPGFGFEDPYLESLLDRSGRPLGDRFSMVYAASPSAYRELTREPATGRLARGPFLVVGDPDFAGDPDRDEGLDPDTADPDAALASYVDDATLREVLGGDPRALARLPRLRFSGVEARAVAATVANSTLLLGGRATEAELVRRAESGDLDRYAALHLATHAFLEPKLGALGTLALARPRPAERGTDGLVHPEDVELGWRTRAELVVFSGCHTGPQIQGQELSGGMLLAAFSSGARSVLSSRWKVHDQASALLMRRFYQNATGSYDDERMGRRRAAMPKDLALREARRWLRDFQAPDGRRVFAHPFYWSAFYLSGDPR